MQVARKAYLLQIEHLTSSIRSIWHHDLATAIAFLLPSFVILSVFSFYPIISVIHLSLFKWDNLGPQKIFIGLGNYLALLNSARFWNSLKVTIEYTGLTTFISIALGLLLAVALNERLLLFRTFWRGLFFLPNVTPTVAAAMVWLVIFDPGIGYVNVILKFLHLPAPNWLAIPQTALLTVILLGIWKRFGFTLIIYLAALQAIPLEYYESAQMDGAGAWNRFWHITRPLVRPTTILLIVLGVIDSFLAFDQIAVMTEGGPGYATELIGWLMYFQGFEFLKMGYGAAISVVMFLIIALFTLLQWRLTGLGTSGDFQ